MWSKTCRYGMMICGSLAEMQDCGFISVRRLGEILGIAPCVLAKVVQRLTRAGILESQRGPQGGVRLQPKAEDLPIRNLVRALDDLSWLDVCPFHPRAQPDLQTCSLHGSWDLVRASVQTFVDTTTIGDLKSEQLT